jgi:hypothetical protein
MYNRYCPNSDYNASEILDHELQLSLFYRENTRIWATRSRQDLHEPTYAPPSQGALSPASPRLVFFFRENRSPQRHMDARVDQHFRAFDASPV